MKDSLLGKEQLYRRFITADRIWYEPVPHSDRRKADADWKDDPSADERWNAGVDFVMKLLCDYLGVDPNDVTWDAATETVDGDVSAVIGNILRTKFGEDWSPDALELPSTESGGAA